MSTKFMSDNSLSELVTKIKGGFLPVKKISSLSQVNLNDYTTTGVYIIGGAGASNSPGSLLGIGYLIVITYANNNTSQFWIDKALSTSDFDFSAFFRQSINSSWTSWVQIPNETKLTTELSKKLDKTNYSLSTITGTLSIAKGGTGATDKSTALANLAYNTVVSGDSTDLNSYTSQAINCFTSTVPAASNIPTGSSGVGMLAVVTSDRTDLYQVWFEMSSGKTDMFMRTRISGTWSSWGKVYNTNDDTGFVNPSLAGVGSEVSNCFVCKRAGMTTINGYVVATPTSTSASSVIVARLSSEYYPNTERVTAVCINESVSENIYYTVLVNTNGYISIRNVAKIEGVNTQTFRFNITYPSDF